MSYINVYPSRINWENEPSIVSPINATNLNKIDYAVYEHDQTLGTWDVTKANQSDLLLSVKSIDYNTSTGVFVFTWQNGTTKTVDLNIEKIPVSFSMSPQGVITMTTDDGTTYTADVGSLIKTYTFADSSVIDFTVTTDASGNKTVTAGIVDGSITGSKLEPNYLANCQSAANSASASATAANGSAEDSEAWAVGQRDGVDVPSTDPAYHNNAKYYAEHGTGSSLAGLSDVSISGETDGQALVYDGASTKWKNKTVATGSTVAIATTESTLFGEDVTLSKGGYSRTTQFNNFGLATFQGVTVTGDVTITTSDGSQTATRTLNIPYFGNYTMTITFFEATITVTYPSAGTCSISDGTTTLYANQNPMAFSIPNTGTWKATATVDGISKDGTSISISTSGQTATDTIVFGEIDLTYDNEFRGLSLTCSDGVTTITKTAPSASNTMSFYPPNTGTWTISGTYSGTPYSVDAEVDDLSVSVSAQLRTYIVATVTLHGANEATIKYVDIGGLQTQTLDEYGEKSNVTITCSPTNPYVTFVDNDKSKVPEKLDEKYFKRVQITNATTDIYVMPDNSLYWYGYEKDSESVLGTNGWSVAGSVTMSAPTYNKNSVTTKVTSGVVCAEIGNKTAISSADKVKAIVNGVTAGNAIYGDFRVASSKDIGNPLTNANITQSGMHLFSQDTSLYSNFYIGIGEYTSTTRQVDIHGLWCEDAHTTPTYYSAACDVLYIKDSSNNIIPIAYTDSEGKCYDAISLPNGTYTFYSTVAKNPDNLSESYSKTVTITSATTDIEIFPVAKSKMLYWYGYQSDNLEICNTANGWQHSYTLVNPTFNKQTISFSSGNNQICGVGTKNSVSGMTAIKTIAKKNSGSTYVIAKMSSKNLSTGTVAEESITSSSDVLTTLTANNEPLIGLRTVNATTADVSALWYE